MRTKAIVVEISRLRRCLEQRFERLDSGGTSSGSPCAALRQIAAERLAALAHVLHLRAESSGACRYGTSSSLSSESARRSGRGTALIDDRAHLLLLVGDVLRLARLAHAVALDGLGEDHRRLAGVLHRRGVGGVDLVRIVAAAVQAPDVVVDMLATIPAAPGTCRRSACARRRRPSP
jgi:hypothetical protein